MADTMSWYWIAASLVLPLGLAFSSRGRSGDDPAIHSGVASGPS